MIGVFKASKIQLAIVLLLYLLCIGLITINAVWSPYLFSGSSAFWEVLSGFLWISAISAVIIVLPRLALLALGAWIGWAILYFGFFYFYNPFTLGKQELYVHPGRLYQVEYPSSWKIGHFQGRENEIYIKEREGEYSNKWNYAVNSIFISHYSKEDYKQEYNSSRWLKKDIIKINKQEAEVFYELGGGSSFSSSSVHIRMPSQEKNRDKIFVLEVDRTWCTDGWGEIANPHAISPERLLKKAWPIIESFEWEPHPQPPLL